MLNKLWLCYNINKFYHVFGESIGVHTKLRDPNDTDFLHSYKLLLKATAIILVIATALAFGINIGRSYTIRQAELLETTNDTYFISFGDEVHEYTFEEVR